jgi:hypothetical protein
MVTLETSTILARIARDPRVVVCRLVKAHNVDCVGFIQVRGQAPVVVSPRAEDRAAARVCWAVGVDVNGLEFLRLRPAS